ncbi:hypothetical protein CAPTEDRAFT_123873, partial [Capitella teleta]
DEKNQILKSNIWLRLYWTDAHLKWDQVEYGGIDVVRIKVSRIWRPDITLYNDVSDELPEIDEYFAAVTSDGYVTWLAPVIVMSSCPLDVTYFPWDQQVCTMTWGSWSFDGGKVNLYNRSSSGDISQFVPNGEWNLQGMPVIRHVDMYACCPEPYPTLEYRIVIKRKSLYYTTNLVMPCAFITACALLVFWLPPESGEKVSLSVTILLTTTVFLLLVAETMPAQSLVIPLISQYFLTILLLLALSTVVTVIILNFHHRGDLGETVPHWMEVYIIGYLGRLVGMKKIVDYNKNKFKSSIFNLEIPTLTSFTSAIHVITPPPECNGTSNVYDMNSADTDAELREPKNLPIDHRRASIKSESNCQGILQNILDELEILRHSQREKSKQGNKITEWMLLGEILDRFSLFVFFIIIVVVHLALLLNHD